MNHNLEFILRLLLLYQLTRSDVLCYLSLSRTPQGSVQIYTRELTIVRTVTSALQMNLIKSKTKKMDFATV